MSSRVKAPQSFSFNACLHSTCVAQFHEVSFLDVQWAYFADDPQSARALMVGEDKFTLNAQSMLVNQTKALVVDTSNKWGGFPEDLADRAIASGYEILVVQEYGDEEYNCGFGALFSNSNRCPIPIFRVSSSLSSQLSNAELVDLNPAPKWPSTTRVEIATGYLMLFTGLAVLIASVLRLYGLGAPRKFNTGIGVCYLAVGHAINVFQWGVGHVAEDYSEHKVLYQTITVAFENVFYLTATYLIAREFEVSLEAVKGNVQRGWKHPRVLAFSVFIVLVNIVNVIIAILVGQQVYGISNIYHSLFFLNWFVGGLFAVYFIWGYRQIIKIMSNGNAMNSNSGTVYMGKRLMIVVFFIILWLIDAGLVGINSLYYFNGMTHVMPTLLHIFSSMIMLAEVYALPLKVPVLGLCLQNVKSKLSGSQRQTNSSQKDQVASPSS
jgi:hypothetical protein